MVHTAAACKATEASKESGRGRGCTSSSAVARGARNVPFSNPAGRSRNYEIIAAPEFGRRLGPGQESSDGTRTRPPETPFLPLALFGQRRVLAVRALPCPRLARARLGELMARPRPCGASAGMKIAVSRGQVCRRRRWSCPAEVSACLTGHPTPLPGDFRESCSCFARGMGCARFLKKISPSCAAREAARDGCAVRLPRPAPPSVLLFFFPLPQCATMPL